MKPVVRRFALIVLAAALFATGCTPPGQPAAKPPAPGPQAAPKPQNPELSPSFEGALQALKAIHEAGLAQDVEAVGRHFVTYRSNWEPIRGKLRAEDAKLEQHIEDGAVELDAELKRPPAQIRMYEFTEEAVKLGALLSKAAEILGVPVKTDLLVRDPAADVPFNQERRIEISASDHKFTPSSIQLDQHTKVTFVVTNKGSSPHEFVLDHYGIELEINPGESKELTLVVLDAGDFEFACHVPGHYEVGMFGTLKVKPAELKQK